MEPLVPRRSGITNVAGGSMLVLYYAEAGALGSHVYFMMA